jgi:hypothetical protein
MAELRRKTEQRAKAAGPSREGSIPSGGGGGADVMAEIRRRAEQRAGATAAGAPQGFLAEIQRRRAAE